MADQVVSVTEQGLGSRILSSIVGVLVGATLVVLAPAFLFWNEGRAVHRAQTLKEGAGAVVEAKADAVDPAHEGKLVHVTGLATTSETLSDPMFGIAQNALALDRKVEMYQWREKEEKHTRKKLGGGTETTTTYTYSREWSEQPQDSASFEEKSGHENPAFPFRSDAWHAKEVRLGAYRIAPDLASNLDNKEDVPLGQPALQAVPPDMQGKLKLAENAFYLGADPASPAVGDVRVTFQAVRPAAASIVAGQNAGTLQTFHAKAGDLALVDYGTHPAAEMFKAAREENTVLTWIARLIGFVLLWIGLRAVLGPLSVLADVVPFFGSVVGFGLGIVALLIAAPVSLLTIAVAWFFFRPLLAVTLVVVGAGLGVLLFRKLRQHAPAPMAAPAFVPPPPPPAPAT